MSFRFRAGFTLALNPSEPGGGQRGEYRRAAQIMRPVAPAQAAAEAPYNGAYSAAERPGCRSSGRPNTDDGAQSARMRKHPRSHVGQHEPMSPGAPLSQRFFLEEVQPVVDRAHAMQSITVIGQGPRQVCLEIRRSSCET